jgi:hypothetical protein
VIKIKKDKAMRHFFPAFLISTGFLLFVGMVAFLLVNNAVENPAPAPLPHELDGISLTRFSTGKAAAQEVLRMHSGSFMVTSASVGSYGRDQATIWVTGSPLGFMAAQMVTAMEEKIRSVESPFAPSGERMDGSRTVYELDGMGQKHFYFQSGKLVIWLAAQPDLAELLLLQTLEYYP